VGDAQRVSIGLERSCDNAVRSAANIRALFTSGHPFVPEGPPWSLRTDPSRGQTLIGPVVPLDEVRLDGSVKPCECTRLGGSPERTGQNLSESPLFEAPDRVPRRRCLSPTFVQKGNIRPPRMLPHFGPFGLAVPEQEHPGGHGPDHHGAPSGATCRSELEAQLKCRPSGRSGCLPPEGCEHPPEMIRFTPLIRLILGMI
jgi:hypothetical protein